MSEFQTQSFQTSNSQSQNVNHEDGVRLQALAIAEFAIGEKIYNAVKKAAEYFQMFTQRIYRFRKQARVRGFDPEVSKQLKLEYVQDAPRLGISKKLTPKIEKVIKEAVRKDRYGREKSCTELDVPFNLFANIVLLCLKRNGFRNVKLIMKFGLFAAMIEVRLQFRLRYEHWTMEDWKRVI